MCLRRSKVAHTYFPAFPTSNRPFPRLVSALHDFTFFVFNVFGEFFLNKLFGSVALFPLCSLPMLRFQFHHIVSQQLSDVLFIHYASSYGFIRHFRSSFFYPCLCAISTWLFWFAVSQTLLLEPCTHFLFHHYAFPQLFLQVDGL